MKSEGRNLDIFDHSPQAMARAFRYAADMAGCDPHWTPAEQVERRAYYLAKAAEYEGAERLEAAL